MVVEILPKIRHRVRDSHASSSTGRILVKNRYEHIICVKTENILKQYPLVQLSTLVLFNLVKCAKIRNCFH